MQCSSIPIWLQQWQSRTQHNFGQNTHIWTTLPELGTPSKLPEEEKWSNPSTWHCSDKTTQETKEPFRTTRFRKRTQIPHCQISTNENRETRAHLTQKPLSWVSPFSKFSTASRFLLCTDWLLLLVWKRGNFFHSQRPISQALSSWSNSPCVLVTARTRKQNCSCYPLPRRTPFRSYLRQCTNARTPSFGTWRWRTRLPSYKSLKRLKLMEGMSTTAPPWWTRETIKYGPSEQLDTHSRRRTSSTWVLAPWVVVLLETATREKRKPRDEEVQPKERMRLTANFLRS